MCFLVFGAQRRARARSAEGPALACIGSEKGKKMKTCVQGLFFARASVVVCGKKKGKKAKGRVENVQGGGATGFFLCGGRLVLGALPALSCRLSKKNNHLTHLQ
jgi:hypothetical protein